MAWGKAEEIGNRDDRLSRFRKCWISDGATHICGVYGPGTSKEITANWTSPFEGESVGAMFQKAGGLVQAWTDMTTVSTLNSRQTWEGNRPTTFTLEFKLYALHDPDVEVMQPLRALEVMMAPDIASGLMSVGGRIPKRVLLNIGTRVIYTDLVIESFSQPFDKGVDSQGRFVRATVNVQLSTLTMVSKDMLKQGYGLLEKDYGLERNE